MIGYCLWIGRDRCFVSSNRRYAAGGEIMYVVSEKIKGNKGKGVLNG